MGKRVNNRAVSAKEAEKIVSNLWREKYLTSELLADCLRVVLATAVHKVSIYHTSDAVKQRWSRILTGAVSAGNGLVKNEILLRIQALEERLNE